MNNFMRKYPRLVGIIFLLIGIGSTVELKSAYASGNRIWENWTILVPFILLYGLAVTIQPRVLILKGEFSSAPTIYKLIYVVIGVVGVGLGLYLRYVVFKNWH